MFTPGWAAYVNGSVNKATALDTGKQISGAPDMTAGIGLLWNAGPWASSLIGKRTGSAYMTEYKPASPSTYEAYKVAAYNNVDFSFSYTFSGMPNLGAKSLKLQLNVFNLANSQRLISIAPGSRSEEHTSELQSPCNRMPSSA